MYHCSGTVAEGRRSGVRSFGFGFWLWCLFNCELEQIMELTREPQFLVRKMSEYVKVWEDTIEVSDFSYFSLLVNQNCFLIAGLVEKETVIILSVPLDILIMEK